MDWAHTWIEAGVSALAEKEAQGLLNISLCLVLLSLSDCSFHCLMAKPDLFDRPFSSFSGAALAVAS